MKLKFIAMFLLNLIICMPLSSPFVFAQDSLQISDVELSEFTSTSVRVSWTTNKDADSTVLYGENATDLERTYSAFSKQHSLVINTVSGSTYKYQVKSCTPIDECSITSIEEFVAGPDIIAPSLDDINIPLIINSPQLDIKGQTEPYSKVLVIVNGKPVFLQPSTGSDGVISIGNVLLKWIENTVELRVTDSANNENSKTYKVKVDTSPPLLKITQFKEVSMADHINIGGNVNENSTIEFYVVLEGDAIGPSQLPQVELENVEKDLVEISWDSSDADDLLEYVVYRNDKRINITKQNSFIDNRVASGQTYRYRVSAVDTSCNEGIASQHKSIPIPSGNATEKPYSKDIKLSCELPVAVLKNRDAGFAESLTLSEGFNKIRVVATDVAGNKAVYENITLYDTQDPVFESTNLDSLSPSYIKDVHVKGKVSEKATVFVYINGKKSKHWGLTDDKGNFFIGVELLRDLIIQGKERAWSNKIKLVAVDLAGRQTETSEVDVKYALCGFGTDFGVTTTDVMPSEITPRDVVEGFARFGFNLEIESNNPSFKIKGNPTLRIRPLSEADMDEWDGNDVVSVNWQWSSDGKKAYVTLSIKQPIYPSEVDTESLAEKEDFISDHRKGECGIPEFGCYKIPLELEIKYNKVRQRSPGEQQMTGQLGPEVEQKIQKVCIPLMVGIQPRTSIGDMVNKKFLENRIMDLGNTIEFLDSMIEPIQQINTVVFDFCLVAMALEFTYDWWTELEELAKSIAYKRRFDRDVARAGLCDHVYDKDSEDEEIKRTNSQCNDFAGNVVLIERVKRAQRHICDRVFCPSAPTLRKYIIDKQKERPLKEVDAKVAFGEGQSKVKVGSDCANPIIDPKSFDHINKIYASYDIYHDDDGVGAGGGLLNTETAKKFTGQRAALTNLLANDKEINCAQLHPSSPACCGYEYMLEWGTACDLPGFYYTTFNELKDSYCIAAQQAGQKAHLCDKPSLRSLTNALSGLCTPETSINGVRKLKELVPTGLYYQVGEGAGKLSDYEIKKLESAEVFVLVDPQEIKVKRGYVGLKYKFKEEEEELDAKRVFITEPDVYNPKSDLSEFFRTGEGVEPQSSVTFEVAFCNGLSKCDRNKAKRVFKSIKSKFIPPEKEYVVDPTSGFLRTMQCVCLPGFLNYVSLWRNILQMTRNCLQQIKATGHGSEGSCEAFLSTYLCDLIWDVIKCVYYTLGGGPVTGSMDVHSREGFAKALGTLTDAGNRIAGATSERYGKTPIFDALFSERHLVHSMCMFAFTGKFDMAEAISTAVEQASTEAIPTNSQGLLSAAQRRFFNYDLRSTPPGQVAYNYRVAGFLNAGANLDYTVKLVCSDDMSCIESYGHKNKRCDCIGIGKQEQVIKQGHLAKLDMFDEEIYVAPSPAPYRYDKVVMEWSYKDHNDQTKSDSTSTTLHEVGSPPGFCSFNIMEVKFLCEAGPSQYYAKFTADPMPVYAPQTTYFKLGDDMKFNVQIQQSFPTINLNTLGSEHTKYLIYEVYNQRNQMVVSNSQALFDPRQGGSIQTTAPDQIKTEFILQNDGVISKDFVLGKVKLENFGAGTSFDFSISATDMSDHLVGGIKVSVVNSDRANTYLPKNTEIIYLYNKNSKKFYRGNQEFTVSEDSFIDVDYGIKIKAIPLNTNLIKITASKSTAIKCAPGTTEMWTVKFAIHESLEDNGEWKPSNQVSYDLSRNAQSKPRTTFTVKYETTTPQPTPTPQPPTAEFTPDSVFVYKTQGRVLDKAKFIILKSLPDNKVEYKLLTPNLPGSGIELIESISLLQDAGVIKLNIGDRWYSEAFDQTLKITDLQKDKSTIEVELKDSFGFEMTKEINTLDLTSKKLPGSSAPAVLPFKKDEVYFRPMDSNKIRIVDAQDQNKIIINFLWINKQVTKTVNELQQWDLIELKKGQRWNSKLGPVRIVDLQKERNDIKVEIISTGGLVPISTQQLTSRIE